MYKETNNFSSIFLVPIITSFYIFPDLWIIKWKTVNENDWTKGRSRWVLIHIANMTMKLLLETPQNAQTMIYNVKPIHCLLIQRCWFMRTTFATTKRYQKRKKNLKDFRGLSSIEISYHNGSFFNMVWRLEGVINKRIQTIGKKVSSSSGDKITENGILDSTDNISASTLLWIMFHIGTSFIYT